MKSTQTIYVRLLGESVDVYRPVSARSTANDRFTILDQEYDPTRERWQFGPGDEVECKLTVLEGSEVPVAVRLAANDPQGRSALE